MRLPKTISLAGNSKITLRQRQSWLAIGAFILFISLLLLVQAGQFLVFLFPASSFAVGIFLYFRVPTLFISFAWWMCFLGPLIRRLIDYQSGYLTLGLLHFTPLLVSMIPILTFLRYMPQSLQQGALPFVICLGSICYGLLTGLLQNPINSVVNELLGWMSPILISFHLFIHWQDYPKYRQTIQQTFLWGVLITGAYGLFQFLVAPEWDRFWLITTGLAARGTPEPLGIRVWSTMVAAHAFATAMMAGLVLLFSNPFKILLIPTAALGYLAFLLTLARSVWISWLVAIFSLLISTEIKLKLRLIIVIIIMAFIVISLTMIEPFSTVINNRLESFSDISYDYSLNARVEGYNQLIGKAFSEILGWGLGFNISSTEDTAIGAYDSSILPTIFQMGLLGSIPYFIGVLLLIAKLFQTSTTSQTIFEHGVRSIVIGVLSQVGTTLMFTGPIGMVFWSFLGLGLAANIYYQHQQSIRVNSNPKS